MTAAPLLFFGGGNMSRAIISGLIQNNYPASQISVVDRNPEKCQHFKQEYGVNSFKQLSDVPAQPTTLILAIKPQDAAAACMQLQAFCQTLSPLFISIMAGITTAKLGEWLGPQQAIIRAMPNTPAAIQAGAAGLFANSHCSSEQKNQAESIMRATGIISWVNAEEDLAAITALSGSGPAYYFYFMEIMATVAEKMGIPAETAHLFAAQTAYGAAKLALESPQNFATLRAQVTSKGGSTAAAITSMQAHDLAPLLEEAMMACKDRALELAKGA